jgi:hypothetical protein
VAPASGGKASSTSFICGTGLKTCSAAKRSGIPEAAASAATDSEDVVVASRALGAATPASRARRSSLAATSSTIASTRKLAPAAAPRSVSTRTWLALTAPLSRPQIALTLARARSADAAERASSTTSLKVPRCALHRAAVAASPQAMAPLPAIASRSSTPSSSVDRSVGPVEYVTPESPKSHEGSHSA